jgi:Spy/CpxP family protein refolding chaperone
MQNRPCLLASLALVALALGGCTRPEEAPDKTVQAPYAGEQQRAIKALSAQEVEGYLDGKGMGFAKAAELNHYPGPEHVLDAADRLNLTEQQRRRTEKLFGPMKAETQRLGRRLVEKERTLDSLFAAGRADAGAVSRLVRASGRLRSRIRAAHLRAHLPMKELLSPEQVQTYDRLRGYEGGGGHAHGEGHSGHSK